MNQYSAKKSRIINILNAVYSREEGPNPNYLLINNEKTYRVNIIGIVVNLRIEENELDVDDGTGLILVKSFEQKNVFENLKIGDLILIIAKPREFGSKYLVPEVVKKTTKEWLELRKKELGQEKNNNEEKDIKLNENEKLIKKIRELDKGSGVPIELLITEPENEERIKRLLKEGELFHPSPGRIKILE